MITIRVSRTLNINARGIVRISQAVAKNMIDAGIKGSIVNVSSTISEVRNVSYTTIILCNFFFFTKKQKKIIVVGSTDIYAIAREPYFQYRLK